MPGRGRIIILGAGFAGVHVAQELARSLPQPYDAEIVLIDQKNYFLFTPMLTEVVGGEVVPEHIVSSIRKLSPRVSFLEGRVDGVDVDNKRVTVALGDEHLGTQPGTRILQADHLVFALGSVADYHGIDGVEEHSLTIKNLDDAAAIHDRAVALLERADAEPDAASRRRMLTVVVAGGGFSGVETMAALNGLLRDSVQHYHNVTEHDIRAVLVHPGEHLLSEIGKSLGDYAQQKLEQSGVEVRLKTDVAGAGADYVELKGGERISTSLLVWTAGVRPSPVIGVLDLKRGQHGGIVVDRQCAVPGHQNLWAVGDCAEVPEEGGDKTYAPTAQNATREGSLVGRNIGRVMRGESPAAFTYHPIGQLALVGPHSGVAKLFGMQFSGMLAWALWRGVYLAKEPRLAKRLRVALDWTLDFFTGLDIAALPGKRAKA
ncbi:MAG TPA: NAD(P)/FAD-dependent oxidoreductase [Chloroflexota bacterium]|nr:NAD(P)/FAD-dependent oxidoreductase [Chloroflexota bacterium]